MRRSLGDWIRHLLSPANTPRIEDFAKSDAEPPADPLWHTGAWGSRHFVGGPDLVATPARRGALRHHIELTTYGPAKGCTEGVTSAGYHFKEYERSP